MLAAGTKPGAYVSRSGRTLVAAALGLAVGAPALAGVDVRIEGQRLGGITRTVRFGLRMDF